MHKKFINDTVIPGLIGHAAGRGIMCGNRQGV